MLKQTKIPVENISMKKKKNKFEEKLLSNILI